MNIKKVFKGFTEAEAREIINQSSLTIDELALANIIFIERKPRLYFCDEFGCGTSKYHYMLNRVMVKLESCLKYKLFAK